MEVTKIAIATDDGKTITSHFGRAKSYKVVTISDSKVVAEEIRAKALCGGHGQQPSPSGEDHHSQQVAPIRDCQVLLARGMGTGAQTNLLSAGIQPLLTSVSNIDEAVASYLAGNLQHHPERIH